MNVTMLVAVACGGAIGSVCRYLVGIMATRYLGADFPFATLIVNILGSFVMGILIEGVALRYSISPELRGFAAIGILGAFTTFSTFSLDAVILYERGRMLLTGVYVGSSVFFSIAALFLGFWLARRFIT